ncbi:hypothetical protein P3X46_019265 [Hevea brasiliensis]|uniref:Transmembrane protein n=2 Tax=Hevea brasiliensis TaxID=3981 RepID=A0ABQ9LL28_HEVBR|nr:hypothetical protein P3X46_019265 [Hevea brasiliensis]
MAGNEEWRKTANPHKMSPEEVKAAGLEGSKKPLGHNPRPEGSLHQRGKLPFSRNTMTIAGLLITAAIGYMVLYAKKTPEASARNKATNSAEPIDTHPSRK